MPRLPGVVSHSLAVTGLRSQLSLTAVAKRIDVLGGPAKLQVLGRWAAETASRRRSWWGTLRGVASAPRAARLQAEWGGAESGCQTATPSCHS